MRNSAVDPLDVYLEEAKAPVTPRQRLLRRLGAVAMLVIFTALGVAFLFVAATDEGKGYQVAPVLALMVGVLFGIPMVSVLVRHLQAVWYETQ